MMNGSSPSSRSSLPSKRNGSFHRYLKPGALAQLRNSRSRIISRSDKLMNDHFLVQYSNVHTLVSAQNPHDQVPCLLTTKIHGIGPHCLKRKKLVGSRTMLYVNLSSSNPAMETS